MSSAGLALPVRSAAHWVVDGSVDAPHVGLRHLLAQTVGQARHDGYLRRPAARAGGMDTIGFGADASSDNRAIAKDLETLGGLEVAALWDCFEKVAARVKGGDAGGTASLERDLDQRMVHHLSRLAQAKHPALTTVLSGYGAQTF